MNALHDVARWARRERDAARRRDEAVLRARQNGATLREIAVAAGLTHAGVARLLERVGKAD